MIMRVCFEEYRSTLLSLSMLESEKFLLASIKNQKLSFFQGGKFKRDYIMSSSAKPPSCTENSLGTPWGLHEICEKIGDGEPLGTVFIGRKSQNKSFLQYSSEIQKENLITTRILRLKGLQEGINRGGDKDSFSRYIYIHGTNHEKRLGQPASSGCLQLSNINMLQLFDLVEVGTHLWIGELD